jgi:hypothetical protein
MFLFILEEVPQNPRIVVIEVLFSYHLVEENGKISGDAKVVPQYKRTLSETPMQSTQYRLISHRLWRKL